MQSVIEPNRLIEEVGHKIGRREIKLGLYSTPNRRTGRRIIARERGQVMFDTGDQFDFANASNRLELWLKEQEGKCAHCGNVIEEVAEVAQDAESGGPICMECVPTSALAACPF